MARQSTKPALASIQAELADPDYKIRKAAITQLMRHYRKQAYEPLLNMLEDARGEVRTQAVRSLSRLKDARALPPVLGLLTDKHISVRAEVAWALGILGDRSMVRILVKLLNDPHARISANTARSLGKLRDPGSLPALLAYLEQARKTGSDLERDSAIRALGDFGTPGTIEPLLALRERSVSAHAIIVDVLSRQGEETLPTLLAALTDPTRPEHVRKCILEALARKPSPPLLYLLMSSEKNDPVLTSEYAISALRNLKDPRAIKPLTRILNGTYNDLIYTRAIQTLVELRAVSSLEQIRSFLEPERLKSASTLLVQTVVKALGELGDMQAVTQLLDLLWQADQHLCQHEIVHALCVLNDATIVQPLIRGLATCNSQVRWCVIEILAHFRDRSAVEALLALLALQPENSLAWWQRERVVRALGKLGDMRALEPLLALLHIQVTERAEISFQKQLIEVLGTLGDPRAIEPLHTALYRTTGELHVTIWNALHTLGVDLPPWA